MVARTLIPAELGGSCVACGLGALGGFPLGLGSGGEFADELRGFGDGQRLDLREVAPRLLRACTPPRGAGAGGARGSRAEYLPAQDGGLAQVPLGEATVLMSAISGTVLPQPGFLFATAVVTLLTVEVAALLPAIYSSSRQPARELRTP